MFYTCEKCRRKYYGDGPVCVDCQLDEHDKENYNNMGKFTFAQKRKILNTVQDDGSAFCILVIALTELGKQIEIDPARIERLYGTLLWDYIKEFDDAN